MTAKDAKVAKLSWVFFVSFAYFAVQSFQCFVPTVSQFDLFPERVTVERVNARAAAGERSQVKAIFLVQFERKPGKHQVFHDRHGWYCADHGAECPAVEAARKHRGKPPGPTVPKGEASRA